MAQRTDYQCEYRRFHHATRGERWIVALAGVICNAGGSPARLVGFAQDITERRKAEAALRESEARAKVAEAVQVERQRLQDVLDMLPAYVVLLSPDYRVPFANRFFEERFGKSEGRRCYEYLFNRTEPCENCETYKVLKTNAPHRWEWTGPDGRNYDIYDFPFTDVDGSPLIMEVGLDITERKQAEAELVKHREHLEELVKERTAELRASEERYRLLYDRNPDGVFVVDVTGRFVVANPACEVISGYPIAELLPKSFRDICAPDQLARTIEYFERAVRERKSLQLETALLHKDGRRVEVWVAGGPIASDDEPLTVHCTARDITERKRMEEEIGRRAEELRATNEELTRFNEAMVGRELRMIELKQEVNALCAQLGQPLRYGPYSRRRRTQ